MASNNHHDFSTRFIIPSCALSLKVTQFHADPNVYLFRNGILMLLYINDILMSYLDDTTNASVEAIARLSEKSMITNLGLAHQFFNIKISHEEMVMASWLPRRPSSPQFANDSI
jgi:hypothetical protein